MSSSLRQNKRKNSFCRSVFATPTTPMTELPAASEHEQEHEHESLQNAPTPSNKAPRHESSSHAEHVESTNVRSVKAGPRTTRVGSRASRLPPVGMDSIARNHSASVDPLEQMYDSTIMYDYLSSPSSMPSRQIQFSPSASLLGFGGLSLSSPAPGNALGLTNDPSAPRQPLHDFREALAMSRHPSDAEMSAQPFGTISYDSQSTLASNTSFDNLVGLTPAQSYSPNRENYHGSSSICFPPLPTPPSMWSPYGHGHGHGQTHSTDIFAEQFADADKETEATYAQVNHRTLAELRRGSTSQMPTNAPYQGRNIPQSQTMPQIPPPDLPRVGSSCFRGDNFVFPAPPTTVPGAPSIHQAPTLSRPPVELPTPLLSPTRLTDTQRSNGSSSSNLKTPFGRFWKFGLKSDRPSVNRLHACLPPVDELPPLPTSYETSPGRNLRILEENDVFDFDRYEADEQGGSSTTARQGTVEPMTSVEEDDEEEEITMDYLEKIAGPTYEVDQDYDYDCDNVSEDDFPSGHERSYTGIQSDPGYPIEGNWTTLSERYVQKQVAGPNPSEIALPELHGKVLHPEFAKKYTIIDELGSGGYGFVCVAINKDGVEVAVKFINKIRQPGSSLLPMAGDEPMECYILRNVRHDNVISYIEQFEDDSFFYVVQELHGDPWHRSRLAGPYEEEEESPSKWELGQIKIATRVQIGMGYPTSGPSSSSVTPVLSPSMTRSPVTPFVRPGMQRRASYDLFECIEHRGFSEFQGRHIFQQLVDAVTHLHDQGIYHRDLKDENVVIDGNLHVKLIDFGSAVHEDLRCPPRLYTEFRGTEAYAAPEIWPKNKAQYLAAPTDIWALGLLLAMVLTRALPFNEGDSQYLFQLKCDIPDPAYDLIRSCLRINPAYRPDIHQVRNHYWLSEQYIRDLANRPL